MFTPNSRPPDATEVLLSMHKAEYDALLQLHTKLDQAFREVYTTLRILAQDVDALRGRAEHAFAALRGFPASIPVDAIPAGCPGWGVNNPDITPCQHCPLESDCFIASIGAA